MPNTWLNAKNVGENKTDRIIFYGGSQIERQETSKQILKKIVKVSQDINRILREKQER